MLFLNWELGFFNIKCWENANLLFGLYHIGNSGCMGFNGVEATSLESGRCWSTNSNGRRMSILAKTFKQLMLWQDLTRQNN